VVLEQARWAYGYQEMRQLAGEPAAALSAGRARLWFEDDGLYYQIEGESAVGPLSDSDGSGVDHQTLTHRDNATAHEQYLLRDGTDAGMTGPLHINDQPPVFTELASDPASPPATGDWLAYFKSGGLYIMDDAGNVTFVAGASGLIDHQDTINRDDP